jgi:hypothetical protein
MESLMTTPCSNPRLPRAVPVRKHSLSFGR